MKRALKTTISFWRRASFIFLYSLAAGLFLPVCNAADAENDLLEMERLSKQLDACHSDLDCMTRLVQEIEQIADKITRALPPGGNTDRGMEPVVSSLTFQETRDPGLSVPELKHQLLSCGQDPACWMRVYEETNRKLDVICSQDAACKGLGQTDQAIANALANIEFRSKTNSSQSHIPVARPEHAASILKDWRRRLEGSLPAGLLNRVDQYASEFSLDGTDERIPLQFAGSGNNGELRVSSPDRAYALQGVLFLQAGLTEKKYAQLLDLAMWCFIRAAQLEERAEHFSNIAFFLNLLRQYEEARNLLARAQQLDVLNPDAHGNMAFSLRRLGHSSAADQEMEKALALELAAESGETQQNNEIGPVFVAPPHDWGLAYFRLARRHPQQFFEFYRRYQRAAEIPLDREFISQAASGNIQGGSSPRAILVRRDQANKAALEQCEASVPPPPGPCPFGSAIAHSSCKGAPGSAEARLLQLKYEKEICRCNLQHAERDVKNHRVFAEEQLTLLYRFDEEWTPRLEDRVHYWQRRIRTLNELYADAPPESGRFNYPWPEQFYQLLVMHNEDLRNFSTDWITDTNDEYGMRLDAWRGWQEKCREADAIFEEYLIRFAFRGPIQCAPITGNTYELNLVFMEVAYFIPNSARGEIGFKLDLDLGLIGGGYWSSAEGASGGKLSGKILGPVSGEVWAHSGGDWGAGAHIDIVGALIPKKINNSIYKKKAIDNLVGINSNHDPAFGPTGITGWKTKIGFRKITGTPPAWVRLRTRSRKSDKWPLDRKTGKIPTPDC